MEKRVFVIILTNSLKDKDKVFYELGKLGKLKKYVKVNSPKKEEWKEHYSPIKDKPFFKKMIEDYSNKPILLAVFEGDEETFEKRKRELRLKFKTGPLTSENKHLNDVLHTSSKGDFEREWRIWKKYFK